MKTVFVTFLIPFFNFENKILGALRIYRGLVAVNSLEIKHCNEAIFTLTYKDKVIYTYVELKKPPLLDVARKYLEKIVFNKDIDCNNPFLDLYGVNGTVAAKPQNIVKTKYNVEDFVLISVIKEQINRVPPLNINANLSLEFKKLSCNYSCKQCTVNFFKHVSGKYAEISSCIGENMFFLVKRSVMEDAIEELILKNVDPEDIYVFGLFDKSYVIYDKSPHTQNASCIR